MVSLNLLEEIVRLAYGDDVAVRKALEEAMRLARLAAPPVRAEELRTFARAYLMPLIARDHGADLAEAVMGELDLAISELRVETTKSTAPPSSATSRARLILVIHAPEQRDAELEDALKRLHFRVQVKGTTSLNLGPVNESPYHGIVAIMDDVSVLTELREQAEAFGYLGAMVLCTDLREAEGVAREFGAVRLLPRNATSEQIVACVQELLW